MAKIVQAFILVATLATGVSTTAWANAGDDGNAGLAALNSGAYDQAIRLFTHALKSGELTGDDKEFAYLNRGKAYLGKGEYKLGIADLAAALKLKPDDSDALATLEGAQPPGATHGRNSQAASATGWGLLGDLAGRYFWYEIPGKDPHLVVIHFEWAEPQQALNYWIRGKSSTIAAGAYRLDPATNKIAEAEAMINGVFYATVSVSRAGTTEFFFINGAPRKVLTTRSPDGSYTDKAQSYANGSWQDADSVTLVELPQADAESQGFFKPKKQ
jgi:tetratricopeptide (TPR) repeat protein